jgi:Lrp/AsnC family transcriptional regulator for asnA, asnC and gidA
MPKKKGLDELDRRILRHLCADGQSPNKVIAKDVGLSESSVRQRVARMQRDKIFRIVGLVDATKIGRLTASVGLNVLEGSPLEIANRISELPETDFVSLCAGTCDINVGVVCASQEELLEVVSTKIRAAGKVQQCEIRIHVNVVKNELVW